MKAFVLCALVAVAVMAAPLAAQTSKPLRFLNGSDVRTLDPQKTSWMQDFRVIDALFEGLLALNPKTLRPEAGMAELPQISDDKLTYTFKLRPDANWSNGEPLTAHDFVWSWQRALDPLTGNEYVQLFWLIDGAEDYFKAVKDGKPADFSTVGVKALDDHTLQVKLKTPTPYFSDLCAFTPFVPLHRKSLEKFKRTLDNGQTEYTAGWWQDRANIVCNGPFTIKEYSPRQHIILQRRPDYWDAAHVPSEQVIVLLVEGQEPMFNMYDQGLADVMPAKAPKRVTDALIRMAKSGQRNDVFPVQNFGTYYYRLNTRRPPLNDVRVRLALNLAVDRELIAHKLKDQGEKPAEMLVPPGTAGYVSPEQLKMDVPRARQLLADAGFRDGTGFPKLTLICNSDAGHLETAEVVKAMWRKNLNIAIDIQQMERVAMSERINTMDYDISRGGWYGDYFDPMTFLELFLSTGENNNTGWGDPQYDRLLTEAGKEPDVAKRNKLLQDAERILCIEQVPIVNLYTYADVILFNPDKVQGVYPNPRMYLPMKYMGRK